jgi:uncharacterized membrane protein YkoI
MKKYFWGIVLLLMTGVIVGCSNGSNSSDNNSAANSELVEKTKVSVNEAIKVYQKNFPKADIVSIELEKHLGKPVYTIEGADKTTEYQLNINAINKKIKQKSEEPLDEEDRSEAKTEKLNLKKVISLKKAAQIAQKAAKGGKATEFKLEQDLGVTFWEVKVVNGSSETEVQIHAQKGKVLKTEKD